MMKSTGRLPWIRHLKVFAACRRGASAVEFALIVPVFLIMVLGTFETGRAFWVKNMMQYAVEQTTRYAMVRSASELSASALDAYAQSQLVYQSFAEIGGTNKIAFTATVNASDVTVAASYNYQFLFNIDALLNLVSGGTGPVFTISATSTVPLIN